MAKKVQKKKTMAKPAAVVNASSISFASPQAAKLTHSAAFPLPTRTASLGSRGDPKDFLDMAAPSVVKFNSDHAVIGGAYHTFMAVRGYPAATEEPALLSHLGAEKGVYIQTHIRQVTAAEERQIIQNASNRSRLNRSNTNDLQQSVAAESDLRDVFTLVTQIHREREPLDHCAAFLDLIAPSLDELRSLKDRVMAGLVRAKLGVDPLLLRQREGFLCANLAGYNAFGAQFERVLPAKSVANLDPNNYSGKTDPNGFYIGKDICGSNLIVDLDRRAEDKTNASIPQLFEIWLF